VNVLFLTHRLPYAPNRGDRVRAFHILRTLAGRADVEVVSLVHDDEEAAHGSDLAHLASSLRIVRVARRRNLVRAALALPTHRPLTHVMLDAPALQPTLEAAVAQRRPDVVLAYCSGMARLALAPPLTSVPFVLDMVDVDSAKWRELSRVASIPLSWVYRREASCLRQFEARATRAAVRSLVVTDREREELLSIAPGAPVTVVPNGVDVESLRPTAPPATDARVVFCGVMNYAPNEEAARLLGRDIWPLVRRRRPDATLTLVGSSPTAQVQALASRDLGIEVTGAVPDVRPYLWSAAVAAAPIVTARGIQNKVLEAVAAGLPTVVTPNIMDSLPATLRPACVSASGAASLADAIVALLDMPPAERRATALRADVAGLAWERQLAPLADILQEAAATRPHRP
jgi:sugar transferase (PEP-CTERM/EpsH1 system associated)